MAQEAIFVEPRAPHWDEPDNVIVLEVIVFPAGWDTLVGATGRISSFAVEVA